MTSWLSCLGLCEGRAWRDCVSCGRPWQRKKRGSMVEAFRMRLTGGRKPEGRPRFLLRVAVSVGRVPPNAALLGLGFQWALTSIQGSTDVFGCFLGGVAPSILLIMWSEAYCTVSQREIATGVGGVSICLGALLCLLCTVMPSLVALAFSVASSALLFRVPVASVVGKAPCSSRADRCDHRFSLARLLLGLAVYGASFELPPAFLDEGTSLVYGGSMPSSSFLFTAATGLCVGETLLDAVI